MSTYIIDSSDLTEVAEAIRQRGGTTELLGFPSEMAEAIENIPGNTPPTGTFEINQNGIYDIRSYANADVNVPGLVPSGTLSIVQNGQFDVSTYENADVLVPLPSGTIDISIEQNGTSTHNVTDFVNARIAVNVPVIVPTGTINISQNGIVDVSSYANADVAVPQPAGTKNISITQNGVTTQDVENYVNARISVDVPIAIGDFTRSVYVDVQPSSANSLSIYGHPLGSVPKLAMITPLSTPSTNKLIGGVITPICGFMYYSNPPSAATFCYLPSNTSDKTYLMDATNFIVSRYNSSYVWDTSKTYRVIFYA